MSASAVLYQSSLSKLRLITRGKVRDIYAVDEHRLLIVATDRISAFDVVLPNAIPDKGRILTALSLFWARHFTGLVPYHLDDAPLETVLPDPEERAQVAERSMLVRALRPLPVEAVVRGYLIGSGWKDYQATGAVCGIALPSGLGLAEALPAPIFTPSTKAELGDHDQNIDFATTCALLGADLAERVRDLSLTLYTEAARYAHARGIIIADTKFEFGLDETGRLYLIDEVLTPDSSRFWPADRYQPGINPPSFDKQYIRDYLESLDWDKQPPAPQLPDEIIAETTEKYREAERRLISPS